MKPSRIPIPAHKAEELLKLFLSMPNTPSGDHLSDEEFVRYATQGFNEQERQGIDQHLLSCEACTARMDTLMTGVRAWSGSTGTRRLAALRARALRAGNRPSQGEIRRLADQLRTLLLILLPLPGALHAQTGEERPESESWSCKISADSRNNYTLWISSFDLALEGMQLRLLTKDWSREIILRKIDNQVSARVSLSHDEMVNFRSQQDFQVEIIQQKPAQAT